ncbi:MAG: ABC transporter ATP-binding protein [Actinomycetes bacterium]|jgi:ATP-binding cassette subfamily B protein
MKLWRLLARYLRVRRRALMALVALQTLQTTAGLLLPSVVARLIDEGVLVGDQGVIWRLGAVMLGISLVQTLLTVAALRFGAVGSIGFGHDVRRDVFRRVMSFSEQEVGRFGASSLITRLTNDVQQVQLLLVMVATMMITAPLTMVVGIVLAVRQDAQLAAILLVAVPLEIVVLASVVVRMIPQFVKMQDGVERVNTVLREQIAGVRVVRAFTREPEESRRFAAANAELTDASMRSARMLAATFPAAMFVVNLSTVAALRLGADRVASGELQVGSLVAFSSYLLQILMSVVIATFMISMIPRSAVSAGRLLELLDTEPSIVALVDAVPSPSSSLELEFADVTYRYPGAEHAVLDGVSFRARAGETTAIIGSTGAGKSTILRLAARLADPSLGTVRLDGVSLRSYDPAWLWSSIGYVPQRPTLFSGTVRSNLHVGRPDASDEDMWAALEVAQAAGFVQAIAGGLDGEIAEGGANLSGGQRQRLAIARAVMAKPAIYLLDDSFSALDLATEARVRSALATVTGDAIVLVVAQRVSSVRTAGMIVVLDDGVVVGVGRHDELVTSCATYAEIVDSQQQVAA